MIRNFPCNHFHSNKLTKYKGIQAQPLHYRFSLSVNVPKHVYKRTCMDDLKHLNKTTSVNVPKHVYKRTCMDDLKHLNKTKSANVPKHVYKRTCMYG